jgi:hypothetical protein
VEAIAGGGVNYAWGNDDYHRHVHAVDVSAGAGVGPGGEGHFGYSDTHTWSFNVPNAVRKLGTGCLAEGRQGAPSTVDLNMPDEYH